MVRLRGSVLVVIAVWIAVVTHAQQQQPVNCTGRLTHAQLTRLLNEGVSEQRLVRMVGTCGVGFELTPDREELLRAVNATDALIKAIKAAREAGVRPRPAARSGAAPFAETDRSAKPTRPGWGVFGMVSPHYRKSASYPHEHGGVRVLRIVEGSPAWNAGLRAGDIVESLEGLPVPEPRQHSVAKLNADDMTAPRRVVAWRQGVRFEFITPFSPTLSFVRQRCQQGDQYACNNLGAFLQAQQTASPVPRETADVWQAACRQGSPIACRNLARWHLEGVAGLVDTDERARSMLVASCDRGDETGCLLASNMARQGKGGREDEEEALKLKAKACELGDPAGCADVAMSMAFDDPARLGTLDRHVRCRPGGCVYQPGRGARLQQPAAVGRASHTRVRHRRSVCLLARRPDPPPRSGDVTHAIGLPACRATAGARLQVGLARGVRRARASRETVRTAQRGACPRDGCVRRRQRACLRFGRRDPRRGRGRPA